MTIALILLAPLTGLVVGLAIAANMIYRAATGRPSC